MEERVQASDDTVWDSSPSSSLPITVDLEQIRIPAKLQFPICEVGK